MVRTCSKHVVHAELGIALGNQTEVALTQILCAHKLVLLLLSRLLQTWHTWHTKYSTQYTVSKPVVVSPTHCGIRVGPHQSTGLQCVVFIHGTLAARAGYRAAEYRKKCYPRILQRSSKCPRAARKAPKTAIHHAKYVRFSPRLQAGTNPNRALEE